jgi:hypothetical protein
MTCSCCELARRKRTSTALRYTGSR